MLGMNRGHKIIGIALLFCSISIQPQLSYSSEIELLLDQDIPEVFKKVVSSNSHPYLSRPDITKHRAVIDRLYSLSQFHPVWLNYINGNDPAELALRLLASAPESGLNIQDYDGESLRWQWYGLVFGQSQKTLDELALFDTALTISIVRYLSDLHFGRITPRQAGFRFKGKVEQPDFAQIIFEAINNREVSKLGNKVEPTFVFYQRLKTALSKYRSIGQLHSDNKFRFTKSLRLGDFDPQIVDLRRLLLTLGDAVQQQDEGSDPIYEHIFDGAMVAAVKRFQSRHGLDADGIIGRKTIAALNTPIASRIHQIELALDRLRWLPVLPKGPLVVVNIPSFQLWAFESPHRLEHQPITMKVVVGESPDWQTPIFNAEMQYLNFSPYWNVPRSIFTEEILPKIEQDEFYLASQNMELVNNFGEDVSTVEFNEQSIALLNSGELRIRQLPGPRNALGRVKFIFPNRFGVYMHDTPAKSLFKKTRRDFSHGCIRVEKPAVLAEFALKTQAGWNLKKIKKAMSRNNRRVKLKTHIPVVIFYSTAVANNGEVSFSEDIYGLDKMLNKALLTRFPEPEIPLVQAGS